MARGPVRIQRSSDAVEIEIVDAATGQPLAGAVAQWEDPDGSVKITASSGDLLAEFTADEMQAFNVWDEQPEWTIVTTSDGVHVSNERVADLLGVTDAEIAGLRVNGAGRQLIVTVLLNHEVSPGVKQQRVLVGTPHQ